MLAYRIRDNPKPGSYKPEYWRESTRDPKEEVEVKQSLEEVQKDDEVQKAKQNVNILLTWY